MVLIKLADAKKYIHICMQIFFSTALVLFLSTLLIMQLLSEPLRPLFSTVIVTEQSLMAVRGIGDRAFTTCTIMQFEILKSIFFTIRHARKPVKETRGTENN